jgi:hypothetical protein
VIRTGCPPGGGANICIGVSVSMDAVAAAGLADDSVGLDLSTSSIMVDANVASVFKRGHNDVLTELTAGDVLFCGLVRRCVTLRSGDDGTSHSCCYLLITGINCCRCLRGSADGSADVTWGCNRTIFSFFNLPSTSGLCAGGGCFPVVSVFGTAAVQLLPIQPQFTLVRGVRGGANPFVVTRSSLS